MTSDGDMWWPEGGQRERPARLAPLFGRALALSRAGVATVGRELVDLVLPPACPACRQRLGSAGGLCAACWQGVRFIERPWCERLGTPMELDLGPGVLSAAALAEPPPFERARSAVAFEGPVIDLVHGFKYGDRTDLAPMFVAWMLRVSGELLANADVVVPVPLHWSRLAARRFNQAALLAHGVAARAGVACRTDLVRRVKRTPQQVGLKRAERLANMRAAFAVPARRRAEVAGKAVVLVDDVFTTGSTLAAVSRTLLAAGAARVDVLTLARVVGAVESGV